MCDVIKYKKYGLKKTEACKHKTVRNREKNKNHK